MDYDQIIKLFLSTSIITGGFIYLAKFLLDKFVEIKIEKYKYPFGIAPISTSLPNLKCAKCEPSAISIMPIRIRNDKPRI